MSCINLYIHAALRAAILLLTVFGLLGTSGGDACAQQGDPPELEQVTKLRTAYRRAIVELAGQCRNAGRTDLATETLAVIGGSETAAAASSTVRPVPMEIVFPKLPREIGPPPVPEDAPRSTAQWHERFWSIRSTYASHLWELAKKLVRVRPSLAYSLGVEAVAANPDNPDARRLLGYQRFRDYWCTPDEVRHIQAGETLHPRFGWIPADDVERYERGERFNSGRWISAQQDLQRHADIRRGRKLRTEHYEITSTADLETTVQLGRRLETLYRLWNQLFIRYYASDTVVAGLFQGRALATQRKKLEVICFRTKSQYVAQLQAAEPQIAMSSGYYIGKLRKFFLFAQDDTPGAESPELDPRNIYHEATHQLFHAMKPTTPNPGVGRNFWIVEGAAMLMESVREESDRYVLGDINDARFRAAHYRRLSEDAFHMPLQQLVALGMNDLHAHPRIASVYSEMAGWAIFFTFAHDGRYRDAMVEYISAVYNRRDRVDTLISLTGRTYEELEAEYVRFLRGE